MIDYLLNNPAAVATIETGVAVATLVLLSTVILMTLKGE